MLNHKLILVVLVSTNWLLLLTTGVRAQDWPQWRGPNRDGAVAAATVPQTWPEQLKLKWKVTVGEGHSSPVVVGQRVFLHSRQAENEVVSAFDLNTGKALWQDRYPVAYTMNPAARGHGKGPKSTPVAHDGKLYTLGITEVLSCYDIATGKQLWRKDFSGQFKATAPDFGTAMSPLIDRGLLIVHVGGPDQGALTAFDANTGAVKWTWTGDGPAYTSPLALDVNGTRQIITQSQKHIIGLAAASGELLWQIPFETIYVQNIVTPLVYKELLIFSGIEKGVMAVKLTRRGNTWTPETIWHNKEVAMYMNSPVLSGDWVFGLSHKNKGQYFALDARTGRTLWTSEGRQGENAALLLAGSVLLSLDTDAKLTVAQVTNSGFKPIKQYTVAESATWAHPVLTGNSFLIKDGATLALWTAV